MKAKLFQMATGVPWLIRQEALQGLLEIAARENLFTDDIRRQIEAARASRSQVLASRAGRPLDGARRATVRDGVATVPVLGPIFRYSDWLTEICDSTTIETLAGDFHAALSDPSVRGIILEVDSPGGQAAGVGEMAGMIAEARGKKPVVAYVSDDGCSGAYWLASAAQEIVVSAQSEVGSVGAVVAARDPTKVSSKTIEFVSSQSPSKRPDPTTERGRSVYQQRADDLAGVFIADVARYRGVTEEAVLTDFGGGGVLMGQAAVNARMADRIGSYESVLSDLANGRIAPRGARPQVSHPTPKGKGTSMNWQMNLLRTLFGGGEAETSEDKPPTTTTAPPVPAAAKPPTKAEPEVYQAGTAAVLNGDERAELYQLREEQVRTSATAAERIKADAEAFASAEIRAGRALPYEKPNLVALYGRAALDDRDYPVRLQFSAADESGALVMKEGTRLEALKAQQAARKPHGAFTEYVGDEPPKGGKLHDNNAQPNQAGALQSAIDKYARAHGANGKN
jgi:ClpP class serine protease